MNSPRKGKVVSDDTIVSLDVGGVPHKTHKSILSQIPLLNVQLERWMEAGNSEPLFIDANGKSFGYLLDFLRGYRDDIPEKHKAILEYLNFKYEIKVETEKLEKIRDTRGWNVLLDKYNIGRNSHLYRVLHEKYLANPMFSMFMSRKPVVHTPYDIVCNVTKPSSFRDQMICFYMDARRVGDVLNYIEVSTELDDDQIEYIEWNGQKFEPMILRTLCDIHNKKPRLALPQTHTTGSTHLNCIHLTNVEEETVNIYVKLKPSCKEMDLSKFSLLTKGVFLSTSEKNMRIQSEEGETVFRYKPAIKLTREKKENLNMSQKSDTQNNCITHGSDNVQSKDIHTPENKSRKYVVQNMRNLGLVREMFAWAKDPKTGTLCRIARLQIDITEDHIHNGAPKKYRTIGTYDEWWIKERQYEQLERKVPELLIYNLAFHHEPLKQQTESGYILLAGVNVEITIETVEDHDDDLEVMLQIVEYDYIDYMTGKYAFQSLS